jgi:hypothetical protein
MKRKLLLIISFLFSVLFSNAQTITTNTTILDIDYSPPNEIDYKLLCDDIATKAKVIEKESEHYEYVYEKRILQLSCVNV